MKTAILSVQPLLVKYVTTIVAGTLGLLLYVKQGMQGYSLSLFNQDTNLWSGIVLILPLREKKKKRTRWQSILKSKIPPNPHTIPSMVQKVFNVSHTTGCEQFLRSAAQDRF